MYHQQEGMAGMANNAMPAYTKQYDYTVLQYRLEASKLAIEYLSRVNSSNINITHAANEIYQFLMEGTVAKQD